MATTKMIITERVSTRNSRLTCLSRSLWKSPGWWRSFIWKSSARAACSCCTSWLYRHRERTPWSVSMCFSPRFNQGESIAFARPPWPHLSWAALAHVAVAHWATLLGSNSGNTVLEETSRGWQWERKKDGLVVLIEETRIAGRTKPIISTYATIIGSAGKRWARQRRQPQNHKWSRRNRNERRNLQASSHTQSK